MSHRGHFSDSAQITLWYSVSRVGSRCRQSCWRLIIDDYVFKNDCAVESGRTTVKKWRGSSDSGRPDFRGIDLSGEDLRDNNFSFCDFRGAKFVDANLAGAVLDRAYFSGSDFTGANLTGARFGSADLSEATFVGAIVPRADFERTVLTKIKARGVDFSSVLRMAKQLNQSVLDECNLEGLNLTGAQLRGTLMRRSNLTRAVLSKADLTFARLDFACLNSALVSGANFQGANLTSTDLTSVHASGAKFGGAKFSGASALPESIEHRNPRTIKMRSPNSHWREDRQPKVAYWSYDEAQEAATATGRGSKQTLGVYVCFDVDPLHWHVGNLRQDERAPDRSAEPIVEAGRDKEVVAPETFEPPIIVSCRSCFAKLRRPSGSNASQLRCPKCKALNNIG